MDERIKKRLPEHIELYYVDYGNLNNSADLLQKCVEQNSLFPCTLPDYSHLLARMRFEKPPRGFAVRNALARGEFSYPAFRCHKLLLRVFLGSLDYKAHLYYNILKA